MSAYPTDADPPGFDIDETGPYGAGDAGPDDEYVGATYGAGEPPEQPAEAGAYRPGEPEPADEWPAEAAGTAWEEGGGAGEPVVPEVVRVAAAVTVLDEVVQLPVGEHVARYEALHGELSDALASIDGV